MKPWTPVQVPARLARDAAALLDRLTNLARGHRQYSKAARGFFTPTGDADRYRTVAYALGDELTEQIAALDVDQARMLLAMLLGRLVANEPPLPRPAVPAGEVTGHG